MRTVEHYSGGPHKLLRVETDGCAVNVVIDLHDPHGIPFIAVEVEPMPPLRVPRLRSQVPSVSSSVRPPVSVPVRLTVAPVDRVKCVPEVPSTQDAKRVSADCGRLSDIVNWFPRGK